MRLLALRLALTILHGSRDRWTDPRASLELAERAARFADVSRVEIRDSGHSMLSRAALWQGLVTSFVMDRLCDQSAAPASPNYPYVVPGDGVHLTL